MPSHCRPAIGLGPVQFHPFSFAKASTIHLNNFDIHRAYQIDSCTSTFNPVKEDPIHQGSTVTINAAGTRTTIVEEVDMETILQLGELQDWWPAPVETQEVKPTNITEVSLPYPAQSAPLSSTVIHPSDMHSDHKCSTTSIFGATETSQSFDLQSWCSGVRSVQSPHIAIPKHMGFPTSAEPSPTTDSSPLRIDREKCSPMNNPQRRWTSNSEQAEKALSIQKKWNGKRAVTQRESHIWSERQRRKGMNHLFSTLRSLLPQPTSKTDKSTVVSEIIKYIQGLQLKLDELNRRRADILRSSQRPIMTMAHVDSVGNSPSNMAASSLAVNGATGVNCSNMPLVPNESCLQSFVLPNVALHFSGINAFITMSSPKKRGLFSRILLVMQTHKLDVVNAHISTSNGTVFHCLHVTATLGTDFPKEALQTALQSLTSPETSL